MLAKTRFVASLSVALLLVAVPAGAETQEVVMTGPYASTDSGTTCGETGWCNNAANAQRENGHLAVKIETAGVHGEAGQGEYPTSTAEAEVTARHTVPDLGNEREVGSIHYTVDLRRDQVYLAGLVGRINYLAGATHSTGVELDGGDREWLYYAGGLVVDPEDASQSFHFTVRGVDGAAIPPGEMDVTIGLEAILGGSHVVSCDVTCVTAGGAAGIIDTALYVDRITATMTTRGTG